FEYWKSYLFNTDGFCYRPGSKHIGQVVFMPGQTKAQWVYEVQASDVEADTQIIFKSEMIRLESPGEITSYVSLGNSNNKSVAIKVDVLPLENVNYDMPPEENTDTPEPDSETPVDNHEDDHDHNGTVSGGLSDLPPTHEDTDYDIGECSEECLMSWRIGNPDTSYKTPKTINWENGEWTYKDHESFGTIQVIVREDIMWYVNANNGMNSWFGESHPEGGTEDWDSARQCYWHYLQSKDPNHVYPDIPKTIFGPDYDVPLNLNPDYDTTENVLSPNYQNTGNEYDKFTHLDDVRDTFGLTGMDQTIVLIDTGLDMNHPAFRTKNGGSRVVGWYDFSDHDAMQLTDLNGNGTFNADLIGSLGPGADLVMLKVGGEVNDEFGKRFLPYSNVVRALQWVIDHKDDAQFKDKPITAVNMSLEPGSLLHVVREQMQILRDSGIYVSTIGGYGFTDLMPVAMMGNDGNRSIHSGFAGDTINRLIAPGERIVGAMPGGGYGEKTGSGVATAYMTGAVSLVYEALVAIEGDALRSEYGAPKLQERIFNLLRNNADSVWDSEMCVNSMRLNLLHTIQNIVGKDTVGNTAESALNLGTHYYGTTHTDVINSVGDVDYYTFTAGKTETVVISQSFVSGDSAGRADWLDAEGNVVTPNADGSFTLDVEMGKTYTFAIRSEKIGKYTIDISQAAVVDETPEITVDPVPIETEIPVNTMPEFSALLPTPAFDAGIVPVQGSVNRAETPIVDFFISSLNGVNRLAEIDMYFSTAVMQSQGNMDFWIDYSDSPFGTEANREVSDAVFESDLSLSDPIELGMPILTDVLAT
ncbi:MAG: S8 family peptidase, partial [Thermoguttaceae bacterium]